MTHDAIRLRWKAKKAAQRGIQATACEKLRRAGKPFSLATDTIKTKGPLRSHCLLWKWASSGNRQYGTAYGVATAGGKNIYAHRQSYLLHRGPIPRGMQIDHLCRVTLCVNPKHLEVVTGAENSRRAKHVRYTKNEIAIVRQYVSQRRAAGLQVPAKALMAALGIDNKGTFWTIATEKNWRGVTIAGLHGLEAHT